MEKIYIIIKERRKELGLSQEELAARVGYTDRSSIAKIESGKFDISLETIKKIAKALELSPFDLLSYLWKDRD